MLRLILKRTIKQNRYNMVLNHVSCKLSEIDEEYVSLLSRIDQAANNDNFSKDLREYYKNLKWSLEKLDLLLPLFLVISKILANHLKEAILSSCNTTQPEDILPPVSYNSLFEELSTWNLEESISCLRYMNLPQIEWDMLIDALEAKDKKKFQDVLYNTSVDIKTYRQMMNAYLALHDIEKEWMSLDYDTSETPCIEEFEELLNSVCMISDDDDATQKVQKYIIGAISFLNTISGEETFKLSTEDLELLSEFICKVENVISISLDPNNDDSVSILEKFFNETNHRRSAIRICKILLCYGYSFLAYIVHSLLDDYITKEEIEHVDKILCEISGDDYRLLSYDYFHIKNTNNIKDVEPEENSNKSSTWFPENFIDLDRNNRFLSIDKTMLEDGGIHFRDFVDDIASKGWIDNTPEAKLRFTYCLTSRICCKTPPSPNQKQPWYGELKHLYWMFINFTPERGQQKKAARTYFCDPNYNELPDLESNIVNNVKSDTVLIELISKYFPTLYSNHFPKRKDK